MMYVLLSNIIFADWTLCSLLVFVITHMNLFRTFLNIFLTLAHMSDVCTYARLQKHYFHIFGLISTPKGDKLHAETCEYIFAISYLVLFSMDEGGKVCSIMVTVQLL